MTHLRKHGVKLLASCVVAAAFGWLLDRGALPWLPETQVLQQASGWALPAYLSLWTAVHVLRALRWHYLLRPLGPVPIKDILGTSFIGFAAIVLLPLRAGEVVRPALLRRKDGLSGWSVMGTIGAERIFDGLFLSLMLLVGLALSEQLDPLPTRIGQLAISPAIVPRAATVALLLFGAAFATMAVFFVARAQACRLVAGLIGWASPRLAKWVSDRIAKVTDGLNFLPSARLTLAFTVATGCYWFLNAWATWVLARGVGLDAITLAQCCVVTGVLALGVMVPNSPGFFGAFQFSVYAALSLYFPEDMLLHRGSVLVFFLYVGQMVVTFAAAALGPLLLRQRWRVLTASPARDSP